MNISTTKITTATIATITTAITIGTTAAATTTTTINTTTTISTTTAVTTETATTTTTTTKTTINTSTTTSTTTAETTATVATANATTEKTPTVTCRLTYPPLRMFLIVLTIDQCLVVTIKNLKIFYQIQELNLPVVKKARRKTMLRQNSTRLQTLEMLKDLRLAMILMNYDLNEARRRLVNVSH